jgi:hypothetical protein
MKGEPKDFQPRASCLKKHFLEEVEGSSAERDYIRDIDADVYVSGSGHFLCRSQRSPLPDITKLLALAKPVRGWSAGGSYPETGFDTITPTEDHTELRG